MANRQLSEHSREVRLVLAGPAGDVVGALPTFVVDTPWWPDAVPVLAGARERFGLEVVVVRLLLTEPGRSGRGGAVTYLAEQWGPATGRTPYEAPTTQELSAAQSESPLRAPWARPGGVREQLAGADGALAAAGRPRTGPARQTKSWNLSCVLVLPTQAGDVWCKATPPVLGDEGALLATVRAADPTLGPEVVAHDPATSTVLLGHVAGSDQAGAGPGRVAELVERLVQAQVSCVGHEGPLLASGSDWRGGSLLSRARALLERPDVLAGLSAGDADRLARLVLDLLPARLADLAACGLPESLVHGDAQPLNWRAGPAGLRLLDWGEAGVGSAALDRGRLVEAVPEPAQSQVAAAWRRAWQRARPGCDPDRAAELAAPVAELRSALFFQHVLDGIEPSEHPYHAPDVPQHLRAALERA